MQLTEIEVGMSVCLTHPIPHYNAHFGKAGEVGIVERLDRLGRGWCVDVEFAGGMRIWCAPRELERAVRPPAREEA